MSVSREQLIFKALVAMSEVIDQSKAAPVQPTAALKFILAWLYSVSDGKDRSAYDEFWQVVQDEVKTAHSESEAQYRRSSDAHSALHGIARRVGVELTADYECEIYQAKMSKAERERYRAGANYKFAQRLRGR